MDQNTNNLKGKTIRATSWSAVDKMGGRLVQLLVYLALANILDPSDFGVVGMLAIFMAVSNIFIDSGFSQALVQNNNPTQKDYSTALYFNIVVGVVCYGILFVCAPFVAQFFDTPLLVPVLRVMSITLVTSSLTVVQRAKLLIALDFKTPSIINTTTAIVAGCISIWAAYNGYGVWALVIQLVGTGVLSMVLYWALGHWWPSAEFSQASFTRLWNFGSKLLAAGVVGVLTSNLYNLLIGKIYKSKELGYYSSARQVSEMSSGSINEVINAVTFPVLSSVKDDRERFVSIYSRMLELTAFIIIPSMTLLSVLARPFVSAVLSEKWQPAVFLIQILCLAKMFTPISGLNMSILKAYGRSDLFMKLDFFKLPLVFGIMAITFPISIEAVVIGTLVDTVLCYFINAYLPGKLFGFGAKQQSKILYKIFLATVAMVLVTVPTIYFISHPWIQLIVGVVVGLLAYIVTCRVLRVQSMYDCLDIIKKIIKRIV